MEGKILIEEVMRKFAELDYAAKGFALGFVTGKRDEKSAAE